MLHDAGSWHWEFNQKVASIRERLLELAGVSRQSGWEAILLQGTGTFGVESVFQSCVAREGKVCVLSNGAYGERMVLMLQRLKIAHLALRTPENIPNDPLALERALAADKTITHVALVHCETTSGLVNPMRDIAAAVKKRGCSLILDAMSSFGAIPIETTALGIDADDAILFAP